MSARRWNRRTRPAAQLRWRAQFPEELISLRTLELLDVDGLAGFLEPGGPLAQVFPGYEHREPQIEMLRRG
ncbi:MAG: hypothetical protein M9927_02540 [Anaerolineae bacterium]|nr:hypothetical protein [Anaerolineae bacterium]